MENNDKLNNGIKKFIKLLIEIFWFPIKAIVLYLHNKSKKILDYVDKKNKENIKEKITNSIIETISGQSSLFTKNNNKKVSKILTFLLQVISFFTTYAGFAFFLGDVNPLAPLFMAITVQFSCYYLMNYSASKKRTGSGKFVLLSIIMLGISICTSYIGVFNSLIKPVDVIKEKYSNYKSTLEIIIDDEIDEKFNLSVDTTDIETVLSMMKNTNNEAINRITSLTEKANNITTDRVYEYTWVDDNGFEHKNNQIFEDIDAANEKQDILHDIENLSINSNNLNNYLDIIANNSEITEAYKNIISNPTIIDFSDNENAIIWANFKNALIESETLYKKLYPDEENPFIPYNYLIDLKDLINNYENKKSLESLKLEDFESEVINRTEPATDKNDLKGIKNLFDMFDDSFLSIAVSNDVINAQKYREIVNNLINENFSQVKLLINNYNNMRTLENTKNNSIVDNVQIMPFILPIKDRTLIGEAIGAFIVAFLVDVLSCLIAFTFVKREKSVLYCTSSDLKRNKEEVIEDSITYLCYTILNDKYKNNSDKIYEVMEEVRKDINNFINAITICYMPYKLNAIGYLSEKSVQEIIMENDNLKILFIAFYNASLLIPCTGYELSEVLFNDFQYSVKNNNDKKDFEKEQIYYLVSKNFYYWLYDSFSEYFGNSINNNIFVENSENEKSKKENEDDV